MICHIHSYDLLNEFRIDSIDKLEKHLNSMAPSLCEYHFENIILYSDVSSCYFNKNQIANEIYIGDFRLYFDYEENIYLEKNKVDSGDKDENLLSLW